MCTFQLNIARYHRLIDLDKLKQKERNSQLFNCLNAL